MDNNHTNYEYISGFTGMVYGLNDEGWRSFPVRDADVVKVWSTYYSKEYFEKHFRICTHCGKAERKSDFLTNPPDGYEGWCSYCIYEIWFWCQGHNRWEFREDFGNRTNYVSNIGNACQDYIDSECVMCYYCGTYMRAEDSYTYTDDDGMECIVCEDCYTDNEDYLIRDYHGNSPLRKGRFLVSYDHTEKPGLGFEWEIQSSDYDYVDEIAEIIDGRFNTGKTHFLFEEDGSIDPGVEAISRPAPIDYWESKYDLLKETSKALVRAGCQSHNGGCCGMHVHIDRAYFGDKKVNQELAEAKFLWIFAKWWDNMVKFSRRRNFGYCAKLNTNGNTIPYLVKKDKDRACGHYTAVNIGNKNTIELRLWRGTLRPETIMATLKFSARLAELVKNKSVKELNDMQWNEILGDDEVINSYWETVKNRT